jgi:hypothetical protein
MYHERVHLTRRRGDTEKNAEKTNAKLRGEFHLVPWVVRGASGERGENLTLPELDGANEDGPLAAVGGIGGQGSIEFELDQYFVAGWD